MFPAKNRWLCLSLSALGALSATTLWAAPQYGGRLSGRMGGRHGDKAQSMMSRVGYGKQSDAGASSQGQYLQSNSAAAAPPAANQPSVTQSVMNKVVPEKIAQVAVDASKKAAAVVVEPIIAPVANEVKSVANAVHQEKDSIEQEIAQRQQELKALQDQLAAKAKEKAKVAADELNEELSQALEIVRKAKLETQKRIEQEKQVLEAGVKKAAEKATQKAEELIEAAEQSVLTGVAKASEKITEKVDAGVEKAAQAAADRLSKLEKDHQLAMQQIQKLTAERQQQQEQMKKLLEQMQQMLTAMGENSKP